MGPFYLLMSIKNLFELASSGALGLEELHFPGNCMSAAIDAVFETRSVPAEVYEANRIAAATELGAEGDASDQLYHLLGSLVFEKPNPEDFFPQDYWFTNLDELEADLAELRGNATILLDTEDGKHSVGLKPIGEDPDKWQIVGIHQIIATKSLDGPVEVQCLAEP
ncbi:MAG TPA: hypothetical protein VM124_03120, partial [Candidatus Limnocylindrales bacterium]|nr:hypothetical protein [Candidatus Limnocylindrales bacterium]